MSETTELSTCPCGDVFITPRLRADHHDWLLSVEDRGFEGAHQLLVHLVTSEESERVPDELHGLEFADFVSCHNWKDPVAMTSFASIVTSLLQQRLGHGGGSCVVEGQAPRI